MGAQASRLQVFPELYLPLMTEGNLRTIRRWRMFLPTPAWWRYRRLLARLDAFLVGLLQRRWREREQGGPERQEKDDLLERRIAGMQV